jgi:WD40 repeat protein
MKGVAMTKLKVGLVLALVVGVVSAGVGGMASQVLTVKEFQEKQVAETNPAAKAVPQAKPEGERRQARTDRLGDPLPPGVMARLGTTRERHAAAVASVAFGHDGKTLVSASYDGTARYWQVSTGKEVRRFDFDPHGEGTGRLISDGARLLEINDKRLRLWDTTTGKSIRTFGPLSDTISATALSPDGKMVLVGHTDGTVRILDGLTGEVLRSRQFHEREVTALAFAADAKTFASVSWDDSARIWDLASGRDLHLLIHWLDMEGANRRQMGRTLVFSPDGKLLATGMADGVCLWEVASGKLLHHLKGVRGWCEAVAFTPDGKTAIGAGYGAVHLWDVTTGEAKGQLQGHRGQITALAVSRDGQILATGGIDQTVRLWDIARRHPLRTCGQLPIFFTSIVFLPDGKRVATGEGHHPARLWEIVTGKELRRFQPDPDGAFRVALSPDGKVLATGGYPDIGKPGPLRLWDVASGRLHHHLPGHPGSGVTGLVFAPDGGMVATSGELSREVVWLWDATTGKRLRDLRAEKLPGELSVHQTPAIAFSPDGKALATAHGDGSVRIWEVATWRENRRLLGPKQTIRALAYSPDNKQVVSGDEEGSVRLWDLVTRQQVKQFMGHKGMVETVAFAPDGRTVAAAGGRKVLWWDVATGTQLRCFDGHRGAVRAIAFAPDGRLLASVSYDSTVLFWDTSRR